MNWVRKVFISLGVTLFVVCCGVVLLFDWSALGWKALSVPTGSMRPTIPPGSLVLMHRVPLNSIKVGDVITYTNPRTMKSTITHRVIKTYKIDGKIPAFITKGDANPSADPAPVIGGLVKGEAIWHVPYIGSFLTWGKGILGITLLVYIPALLIIIDETKRLADYYRSIKLYRVPGFISRTAKEHRPKLAIATTFIAAIVGIGLVLAPQVQALLTSNTVTLGPNKITVAKVTPPTNCTTTTGNSHSSTNISISTTGNGGSNNVNVSNTTNQNSSTGNVHSSGGNATSGSSSNTNCTNININAHNGH